MIVLDTNVVSELMRPAPAPGVVLWLRDLAVAPLATTAITIAEIRFGLARMPPGRRADELRRLADDVLNDFPSQVLPFDLVAAERYGEIVAARERAGRPIDALDGQIAAICSSLGASLATRNTQDFLGIGLDLIDPWAA